MKPEKCPHCDSPLEEGYGLAGGGIGPYLFCAIHGVVWKEQDEAAPSKIDVDTGDK